MQEAEKTRTIYLNDATIVTVKIRSVNMTDGWGIKLLQDKVTCFHVKLIDFKLFLMMAPAILHIFVPERG